MSQISVVIPSYKSSRVIRETLGSVFAQTRLPDEVIVVDDFSPDDTLAIVQEIAATAPVPLRTICLPKNHGGPAHSLNVGIEAATGDLIAPLDHDDVMTPNRLADQTEAVCVCPGVGLVLGRLTEADLRAGRNRTIEKGWGALRQLPAIEITPTVLRIAATQAYSAVLRHGCYGMTCSAYFFPKTTWKAIGGFDERIRTACDLDFLQATTRNYDIAYTTALVAEWSSSRKTLFSDSTLQQRFDDYWIVLDRFAKDAMPQELKPIWLQAVREYLFDNGYSFRQSGLLRRSALCQFRALRRCGVSMRLLKELIKVGIMAMWPSSRKASGMSPPHQLQLPPGVGSGAL